MKKRSFFYKSTKVNPKNVLWRWWIYICILYGLCIVRNLNENKNHDYIFFFSPLFTKISLNKNKVKMFFAVFPRPSTTSKNKIIHFCISYQTYESIWKKWDLSWKYQALSLIFTHVFEVWTKTNFRQKKGTDLTFGLEKSQNFSWWIFSFHVCSCVAGKVTLRKYKSRWT